MKTLSDQKKQSTRKRKIILGAVLAVLLLTGASVYAYSVFKASEQAESQERAQKYGSDKTKPSENTPSSNDGKSGGSITSPKPDDSSTTDSTPTVSTAKPAQPTGTFVSNHKPNLSGSPRPNTVSSTCSTTAGVTCYIEFTNGSLRRTLPAQTTDMNGNTVWNWQLSDIGITEGSWKITAVAINGSQEARTGDPILFEVEK